MEAMAESPKSPSLAHTPVMIPKISPPMTWLTICCLPASSIPMMTVFAQSLVHLFLETWKDCRNINTFESLI